MGYTLKRFTFIGQSLLEALKAGLMSLLMRNLDIFMWALEDMPRINPRVICHKLAIDPKVQLMAQKKRKLRLEKQKAAMQETKKLL